MIAVAYQGDGHQNDDQIREDVASGEDAHLDLSISAEGEHLEDGRLSSKVPVGAALEDGLEEEGDAPERDDDDHRVRCDLEPAHVAENAQPEVQDRDFDEREVRLLDDAEDVLDPFGLVLPCGRHRVTSHHGRVAGHDVMAVNELGAAVDPDDVQGEKTWLGGDGQLSLSLQRLALLWRGAAHQRSQSDPIVRFETLVVDLPGVESEHSHDDGRDAERNAHEDQAIAIVGLAEDVPHVQREVEQKDVKRGLVKIEQLLRPGLHGRLLAKTIFES